MPLVIGWVIADKEGLCVVCGGADRYTGQIGGSGVGVCVGPLKAGLSSTDALGKGLTRLTVGVASQLLVVPIHSFGSTCFG